MCGGQNETEIDLSPHSSVSPCQLLLHQCFILIQLPSGTSTIESLVSAVIQNCVYVGVSLHDAVSKTEVLRDKPIPVPLCPPKIPYKVAWV